jgi:hypothetical protein
LMAVLCFAGQVDELGGKAVYRYQKSYILTTIPRYQVLLCELFGNGDADLSLIIDFVD